MPEENPQLPNWGKPLERDCLGIANQKEAYLTVTQLRKDLSAAVSETNAAHEALGAFMKLELQLEVTARAGRTARTELVTSFQTGNLRAMLNSDNEREAFIGCGVAIMRQAKAALGGDLKMVLDEHGHIRASRAKTFKRNPSGGWLYRLAKWALFKLMPINSEIVLRKL